MSQRTTGVHAVLSHPRAYQAYQRMVGSHRLWRHIIDELALPPGGRLLDIGCGPGDVVEYLGDVDYVGFDLSESYIDQAEERFGHLPNRRFFAADVTTVEPDEIGPVHAVLAHGVLHHVSDEIATGVFDLGSRVLAEGGAMITVDGCYADGQSRAAKFLLDQDRGRHVRTADEYVALAARHFAEVSIDVRTDLLRIPYTMAVLRASGPLGGAATG